MKTLQIAALAAQLVPGALSTIIPKVKGTPMVVASVADPSLNRDSCSSTKIGARTFWTCRDTQQLQLDGTPEMQIVSTSASWSDFHSNGTPAVDGGKLAMYGQNNKKPFFPLLPDECNTNTCGECGDSTRFAIWPDSAPLVTNTSASGSATAYTWIQKHHITEQLTEVSPQPATTLYRIDFSASQDQHTSLPPVTTVDANFWTPGQIPYGNYGGLVHNDTAYLWGKTALNVVALARVPAAHVEDKSQYQFFRNGAWSSSVPAPLDLGIDIPSVSAGGQGTYYYSEAWKAFVWIGQAAGSVGAEFFVTTAPAPEGPWAPPVMFYTGASGDYSLGAYSLVAHPEMSAKGRNEIYLSYTINDMVGGKNMYTTPLIYVEWDDGEVLRRDVTRDEVAERMRERRRGARHRRSGLNVVAKKRSGSA